MLDQKYVAAMSTLLVASWLHKSQLVLLVLIAEVAQSRHTNARSAPQRTDGSGVM